MNHDGRQTRYRIRRLTQWVLEPANVIRRPHIAELIMASGHMPAQTGRTLQPGAGLALLDAPSPPDELGRPARVLDLRCDLAGHPAVLDWRRLVKAAPIELSWPDPEGLAKPLDVWSRA